MQEKFFSRFVYGSGTKRNYIQNVSKRKTCSYPEHRADISTNRWSRIITLETKFKPDKTAIKWGRYRTATNCNEDANLGQRHKSGNGSRHMPVIVPKKQNTESSCVRYQYLGTMEGKDIYEIWGHKEEEKRKNVSYLVCGTGTPQQSVQKHLELVLIDWNLAGSHQYSAPPPTLQ